MTPSRFARIVSFVLFLIAGLLAAGVVSKLGPAVEAWALFAFAAWVLAGAI